MIRSGNGTVTLAGPALVTIQADGPFRSYACNEQGEFAILGPLRGEDRKLRCEVPRETTHVKVLASSKVKWQLEFQSRDGREYPDPTPVELPVNAHYPESLQDQMRRMIRDAVSAYHASNEGRETFEEADDFDIGDEGDEILSQYEMHELQEEPDIPNAHVKEASDPLPSGERKGSETSEAPPDAENPPS